MNEAALHQQISRFRKAWESRHAENFAKFFAPDADVLTSKGLVRGRDNVQEHFSRIRLTDDVGGETLAFLGSSAFDLTSVRSLGEHVSFVDGMIEHGDRVPAGWFTEVWKNDGGEWQIVCSRARSGVALKTFEALNSQKQQIISDGVKEEIASQEAASLKALFVSLRAAWKSGDTEAMRKSLSEDADAIASFGFLQNKAQIIQGAGGICGKMNRLNSTVLPADFFRDRTRSRKGELTISGEAKSIRIMAGGAAVVDGTIGLSGIPPSHGFAPTELAGLYTDLWHKQGGQWKIVGTRPWF